MIPHPFDFFNAADWIVPQAAETASELVNVLGLPPLRSSAQFSPQGHSFDSYFFRVRSPLVDAPTRLELLSGAFGSESNGRTTKSCPCSPNETIGKLQQDRAQRVHATVLVTSDFERVLDQTREDGVPIYVEDPCVHIPWPRLWIGWNGNNWDRRPGFDGDLYVEVIPSQPYPSAVLDVIDSRHAIAACEHIEARVFVVRDLERSRAEIKRGLRIELSPTELEGLERTSRSMTLPFRHPGSASIVFLQPAIDTPADRYLRRHGPGLYLTSLRCPDWRDRADHAVAEGARRIASPGPFGGEVIEVSKNLLIEIASLPENEVPNRGV